MTRKKPSELRAMAREALRGKWPLAVGVGLVAMLLDGSIRPEVSVEFSGAIPHLTLNVAGQTLVTLGEGISPGLAALLGGAAVSILSAGLALGLIYFVVSSVVALGYARFNLALVDGNTPAFSTLFSCFRHWVKAAVARLLQGIFIFLWTLLLVIPGIVATYSYAMTDCILAEHPELSPREAIALSKDMMEGNRWSLFCLEMSFLGWMLLSLIPLVIVMLLFRLPPAAGSLLAVLIVCIGQLWLHPYRHASRAAFYRQVSEGYFA